MFKKYFTPGESNRRLPLVKKIVSEILERSQRFRELAQQNRGKELPRECAELEGEIEGLMHELDELGCYFKDWNFQIGLVDFPAKIDGQDVFLCWRSDEPSVRWYHGIEDGYLGRQAIPNSLLKA